MFDINDNYINVTIPFDEEVVRSHAKNSTKVNGVVNGAVNKIEEMILSTLENNPSITRSELSKAINKGTSTVYRYLKLLQAKNLIKRVGSDKAGHWEIKK